MYFFRTHLIYLFFFISFFLAGCENQKRVDVSKISVDIRVERFDRALDSLNPSNLSATIPALMQRYGLFYNDFIENILSVGSTGDTLYYKDLRRVLEDPDYISLKKEVYKVYPDLDETEKELTDAFRHVRYYYPKKKLPRLISFFSGFAYQTLIGDDYIGIGLDMFLGSDSKFYPALIQSIPFYISRRFTPDNITPRVIETFVREDLFPERDEDRSLLAKMIYNGKILYFMNAVLPDTPDSLIIGETKEQLEWSKTNEANVWGYFLQENLLYETDYKKIQKYLSEAPFTPGMGEDNKSAPKLGMWAGWQIVKEYMAKREDVSLQELMSDTDYQKILNLSKYKPK